MNNTKPNRDITAEILKELKVKHELYGAGFDSFEPFVIEALSKYKQSLDAEWEKRCLEVIGEDEWEDPDIEGSDQSNGDMVVKPWRRNGLRAEQRQKLKEMK